MGDGRNSAVTSSIKDHAVVEDNTYNLLFSETKEQLAGYPMFGQ